MLDALDSCSATVVQPVYRWALRLSGALKSKEAFLQYIHTEGNAHADHSWTNEDLRPSPPHAVNWRWYNFCLFWFGMGFGNWWVLVAMIDPTNTS